MPHTNPSQDASSQERRFSPAQCAELLNALHKKLFDGLIAGINSVIVETEKNLLDGASHATSNEMHNTYMEGVAALRPLQDVLVDRFLSTHEKIFDDYFHGELKRRRDRKGLDPDTANELKQVGLSLLSSDDHEEMLLVKTMTSKLNRKYGLEMVVMRRRLQYLAGMDYGDEEATPFCPDTVGNSFYQVIHGQDLKLAIKATLYMQFDLQVMALLQDLYQFMDGFFVENQVLPNLSADTVIAEQMAAEQRARQAQSGGTGQKEPVESPELAADMTAQAYPSQVPSMPAGGQAGGAMTPPQGTAATSSLMQGRQAADGMPASAMPAGTEAPFQQQIEQQISEINHLLGGYRNTLGVVLPTGSRMLDSFAPVSASQDYSEQEVLQALRQMQQHRATASLQESPDTDLFKQDMYRNLTASSANPKDFRVGADQSNLIDLVGMLFDFVKEEDRLATSNKNALVHLQNLYCQVALKDTSFFHNTAHPAHLLLNRMVQAGSQFSTGNESTLVKNAIEETVRKALSSYEEDPAVFDDLLQRFDNTVATLQQRIDKREQRAIEAIKGREKLIFARKHARGFIEACLNSHELPEMIREFLQNAWSDVLVFIFLRSGPSSKQWQDKARAAEQLAWSCTPLDSSDYVKFLESKEALLMDIRQGLEMLGCHSDSEIQRVIQDISICQQAVQANDVEVVDKLVNTLESTHAQVDEEEIEEPVQLNEAELSERGKQVAARLDQVRFGTHFEFKEPPYYLKLAWFSPTTKRYMFVDHAGQGSYVRSWKALFDLLLSGDASIVEAQEKVPFFERALKAIQATLRQFSSNFVEEVRQSGPAQT